MFLLSSSRFLLLFASATCSLVSTRPLVKAARTTDNTDPQQDSIITILEEFMEDDKPSRYLRTKQEEGELISSKEVGGGDDVPVSHKQRKATSTNTAEGDEEPSHPVAHAHKNTSFSYKFAPENVTKRDPDFRITPSDMKVEVVMMEEDDASGHDHHRHLTQLSHQDEITIAASCEIHSSVLGLGSAGGYACEALAKWVLAPALSWLEGIFEDHRNDDAWVTISASTTEYAEGNALEITWWSANDVDKDSLGSLDKGETDTWREDLGGSPLKDIELRIDETNDICVTNFVFTVGKDVSGTGRKETLDLPAWVVGDLTNTALTPDCIWFGDSEGAVGNFFFDWPTALACFKSDFKKSDKSYYNCLTWAMNHYDKRTDGRFVRWTYG